MSVERAIYYQKYTGLSSDEKPLPSDLPLSLMPGAEFYETDTLATYIWDGDSWERRISPVPQYALRMINTAAAPTKVTYIGEALPGTPEGSVGWRIKKMTETDSAGLDPDLKIEWANGSDKMAFGVAESFRRFWEDSI